MTVVHEKQPPAPRAKRHRGDGEIFRVGRIYYCRYSVKGIRKKESSKSTRRGDAVRLLNRRRAEIAGGHFAPDAERVTFDDLARLVRDDYALNYRKSADRLEFSFAHLREEFEHTRAVDITLAHLTSYANKRRAAGAANATIKNELAALRRGFNLAVGSALLHHAPAFPKIRVQNARQGFLSDAEFDAIMAEMSNLAYVAPLTFAYLTGWRLASEVLTLKWANVDLAAGVVKLEPNTVTKNDEGRTLPTRALPEIHAMLAAQRTAVSKIERELGIVCSLVFPRLNGRPIKSLRGAWNAAAKRAGLDASLIHDLRRSAARRYTAAGVSRGTAMALAGWKTEAIFNRYNIVSADDLTAGLEKVAEHRSKTKPAARVSHAIRPRSGLKAGKAEVAPASGGLGK